MFRFLLIKELKDYPGHGSISFQINVLKSGQFVLFPPVLLTYIHRDVRRPLDRDSSSNCQQCQHGEHMGQTSGYLYTSVHQLWKVITGNSNQFLPCSVTIGASFMSSMNIATESHFTDMSRCLLNRLPRSSSTSCQYGCRRASKGINRNQDLQWALQLISLQSWPVSRRCGLEGMTTMLTEMVHNTLRIALGWFSGSGTKNHLEKKHKSPKSESSLLDIRWQQKWETWVL